MELLGLTVVLLKLFIQLLERLRGRSPRPSLSPSLHTILMCLRGAISTQLWGPQPVSFYQENAGQGPWGPPSPWRLLSLPQCGLESVPSDETQHFCHCCSKSLLHHQSQAKEKENKITPDSFGQTILRKIKPVSLTRKLCKCPSPSTHRLASLSHSHWMIARNPSQPGSSQKPGWQRTMGGSSVVAQGTAHSGYWWAVRQLLG